MAHGSGSATLSAKGSRVSSSGRSSVADRFGWSEPYTVGVEEEYMLLDPVTLDLAQRADTVLEAEHEGEFTARTACSLDVPDARTAIQVIRLLRPRIADLIALSVSSPFWRGLPTGLCSTRHSILATAPRSGTPPAFRDYGEFATYVGALERAGIVEDYTQVWWDLRPHPRLGTVEVRAMDALERVEDAIALAGYVQALVKRAAEAAPPPPPTALEDALVRENKWQAIRHGLQATLVGAGAAPIPIRDNILSTLDDLAEVALELESEAALLGIERIVRAGTGAERQLAVFATTADVRAVTRTIAEETCGAATAPA
jgi:carboxylate-amine ligase